jgi:biopolymer transport protein ExbD
LTGISARRRPTADDELNLVPIMNLITILIPFLLLSVQFVGLAAVDASLPTEDADLAVDGVVEEPLTLLVRLTSEGLRVRGAEDVLGPDAVIPCAGPCASADDFDWRALSERLGRVKDAHPEQQTVLLVPDAWVSYGGIVAAMEATGHRLGGDGAALFPRVVLAAPEVP